MPITIRCPSCSRTLRVPDELQGQQVKCPSCAATFTGAGEGESPPPSRPTLGPSAPEEGFAGTASRQTRPPERVYEEAYSDEGADEGYSRRRAKAAVLAPSICLIIYGVLVLLNASLGVAMSLMGVSAFEFPGQGPKANPEAEFIGRMIGITIAGGVALLITVLTVLGGIKMKNLESYGLAMAGSIAAMIPCTICCIFGGGLPLGIWSLVMLTREYVKSEFR